MVLEHLPQLLDLTPLSGHRGYMVVHTVAGLLPECGGTGWIVGLILGIALTVNRIALRGELDVIEACGIAPSRWMLFSVRARCDGQYRDHNKPGLADARR